MCMCYVNVAQNPTELRNQKPQEGVLPKKVNFSLDTPNNLMVINVGAGRRNASCDSFIS